VFWFKISDKPSALLKINNEASLLSWSLTLIKASDFANVLPFKAFEIMSSIVFIVFEKIIKFSKTEKYFAFSKVINGFSRVLKKSVFSDSKISKPLNVSCCRYYEYLIGLSFY